MASPPLVLVLNSGSSSLKYQLIEPDSGRSLADGTVEQIGEPSSPVSDHGEALQVAFEKKLLKGKAIGVHLATGAAGVFPTQSALAAAGVAPGETTMVTVGMNQQAMDALASGKVAALGLPMYEMVPFIAAGAKLRILRHPILGYVANGGYASTPSVIAAKSDALGRFSRAIVKASLLIRYNPSAAARALLVADGKPFTDEDLRKKTADLTAWEDDLPASDPTSRRIGGFSIAGMQRYSELLAQGGVSKTPVPAADVVTVQFIKFANDFDRKAFKKRALAMR